MSNPTISFRLSQHQIAAGLNVVRQLEPKYKFSSPSKLVKTIYFDYIAKMTLNKKDIIHQQILNEVDDYFAAQVSMPSNKFTTLQEFINNNNEELINNKEQPPEDSQSIKSTVEDWSPSKDWDI